MNKAIVYPESFPNQKEELLLQLILCPDSEFRARWDVWRTSTDFNVITNPMVRLLPMLSLRLRHLNIHDEPADRIHGTYKLAWVKNQLLLEATKKIIVLFSDHGIPTLLLKGIPLLIYVYKDDGARFLGDADILIPEEYIDQAIDLMITHGWKYLNNRDADIRKLGVDVVNLVLKEITFRDDKNIELDIHWKLFDPSQQIVSKKIISQRILENRQIIHKLWNDSLPMNLGLIHSRILRPEVLFLHVVLHGSVGNEQRTLRWAADAIYILRTYKLDWRIVMQKAEEFRGIFGLQVACSYLNRFSEFIPNDVWNLLMQKQISKNERRLYYKSANHVSRFGFYGNFPSLWNAYRVLKNTKTSKQPPFLDYLSIAWGLPSKNYIPIFVANKYINKVKRKINLIRQVVE